MGGGSLNLSHREALSGQVRLVDAGSVSKKNKGQMCTSLTSYAVCRALQQQNVCGHAKGEEDGRLTCFVGYGARLKQRVASDCSLWKR